MRGRLIGALAAGAALVASIVMSAPANAVPATWTVTPGGPFTGVAGTTVLKVQETGVTLTCQSATAAGTADSGTGQTNPLGTLPPGSTKFFNCSGPFGLTFNVTHTGTWNLNGVSYSSGVTTGNISNVTATISGPGCAASVAGSVIAKYTNSSHTLATPGTDYGLVFTSASGCLGLISTGQHASFTSSFNISPAMTITSP
jgi:hypothetical protein